jgi:predicted transcriptional regulator
LPLLGRAAPAAAVGFLGPFHQRYRVGDRFARTREDGMAKRSMGELERAVMDILWDSGGWLTPGEVHSLLQDPSLAYTTVMTVLVRLWGKGRVERQRDGRAYAYHPVVTREQSAAARMEEVLAEARDRAAVLSHFLNGMDPADRAQLRRLLNSYRSS